MGCGAKRPGTLTQRPTRVASRTRGAGRGEGQKPNNSFQDQHLPSRSNTPFQAPCGIDELRCGQHSQQEDLLFRQMTSHTSIVGHGRRERGGGRALGATRSSLGRFLKLELIERIGTSLSVGQKVGKADAPVIAREKKKKNGVAVLAARARKSKSRQHPCAMPEASSFDLRLLLLLLQNRNLVFGKTICTVEPKACNGTFMSDELDLKSMALSGTIPPQLGQLSQLKRLFLWGNYLSGSLPSELRHLSHLQYLDLKGNRFSGSIPRDLSELSELKELDLRSNMANRQDRACLSGTVPPELSRLTKLTGLGLGENRLSGTIPPAMGLFVAGAA